MGYLCCVSDDAFFCFICKDKSGQSTNKSCYIIQDHLFEGLYWYLFYTSTTFFRYVHSYQSYLWNHAASKRVQKYGKL